MAHAITSKVFSQSDGEGYDIEILNNVEVRNIRLGYSGDPNTVERLERNFQRENALRYLPLKRISSAVAVVFLAIYSIADYLVFKSTPQDTDDRIFNITNMWPGTVPVECWTDSNREMNSAKQLVRLIAIVCPIVMIYLSSNKGARMRNKVQLVIFVELIVIATFLLVYKVTSCDYSYGLPCLFITFMFSFTSLRVYYAAAIGFVTGFIFVLLSAFATGSYSNTVMIITMFLLVLGFPSYSREKYQRMSHLSEQILFAKERELAVEERKTSDLLASMLPVVVARKLQYHSSKNASAVIGESFSQVTVLFCEVCNFNYVTKNLDAEDVVKLLNILFSEFDKICEDYGVYKVETVGQVYMVVSGCPTPNRCHCEDVAELALDFMGVVEDLKEVFVNRFPKLSREGITIRIGMNSGPIVAGVVGTFSPRYKLFGNTVNLASRMNTTCEPGMIQISESSYNLICTRFKMLMERLVTVKGREEPMTTYYLHHRNDTFEANDTTTWTRRRSTLTPKHASTEKMLGVDAERSDSGPDGAQGTSDILLPTGSGNPLNISKKQVMGTFADMETLYKSARSNFSSKSSKIAPADTKLYQVFSEISERRKSTYSIQRWWNLVCFQRINNSRSEAEAMFHQESWPKRLLTLRVGTLIMLLAMVGWGIKIRFIDPYTSSLHTQMIVVYTTGPLLSMSILYLSTKLWMRDLLPLASSFTFFGIGLVMIATSVLGEYPNYGSLALAITYMYSVSLLVLWHRVVLSMLLTCVYVISLTASINMGVKYHSDSGGTLTVLEVLSHGGYLVMFSLLQAFTMMFQEYYQFRDFQNRRQSQLKQLALWTQKQKTLGVLLRLLPPSVVPKLMSGSLVMDKFSDVTILFTDMVQFTRYSSSITPLQLMKFLNVMYTKFDEISQKYNLFKVEIIGDAYFAVGGCPIEASGHSERTVLAALEMMAFVPELTDLAGQTIKLRIGLHAGPVVAGVVGIRDPRYHVFGDSVHYANKMEEKCPVGMVNVSSKLKEKLQSGFMAKYWKFDPIDEDGETPLSYTVRLKDGMEPSEEVMNKLREEFESVQIPSLAETVHLVNCGIGEPPHAYSALNLGIAEEDEKQQ